MADSGFILLVSAEIIVGLLLICLLLFWFSRKQKKLIKALEEKVLSQRAALKEEKKQLKEALAKLKAQSQVSTKSYQEYLEDKIAETVKFHHDLEPDQDIVLDIAADVSIERQIASLRHKFLLIEKEADYAQANNQPIWNVLQPKLSQLIEFYEQTGTLSDVAPGADHSAEIETLNKRISNLEGFKKLYLELEKKWSAIQSDANQHIETLKEKGVDEEGLERLRDIYGRLAIGTDSQGAETEKSTERVVRMDIAAQEEIERLHQMAVNQHQEISDLKKRLNEAESVEDFERLSEDLQTRLDQQTRLMKEYETCSSQMEGELERLTAENETLQAQLKTASKSSNEEQSQLEALVTELTAEGKVMLDTLAKLEQENRELQDRISEGGNPEETEALKKQLADAETKLSDLQEAHLDLEERYLNSKLNQA